MSRFYLQMHITNKCNNRCKQCYQVDYDGSDMDLRAAKMILKEFSSICKEASVRSEVSITGGNPVLSNIFMEITKEARKLCDVVRVLGNPEGLNKNIIRRLKKIGIDGFQLSLDGSKSVHDRLREQGSFDRTIDAIKSLSNFGIAVFINATLSDENRSEKDFIKKTAFYSGANNVSFEEYVPHGQDCKKKHDCSLGTATMAILPNLTLIACRRTPSSILGKWSKDRGLFYHLVKNKKMIKYRLERKNLKDNIQ